MKRAPKHEPVEKVKTMVIMLEGHLFDSGLINQVLDIVDSNNCGFEFKECHVRPKKDLPVKSTAILKITGSMEADFSKLESKIAVLVAVIESADATCKRMDHPRQTHLAQVENQDNKTVLLLGSGRVSKSVLDLLGRSDDRTILVASDNEAQARDIASYAKRGRHAGLDIANDTKQLSDLIQRADVVISLLPVPMHPKIAELCLGHQTDMVTASYESKEMRELDERYVCCCFLCMAQSMPSPDISYKS
jgi:alpha-aminoadipic semialdehyde synthase